MWDDCSRVTRGNALAGHALPALRRRVALKIHRSRDGASSESVTAEQLKQAGCWVPPEVLADAAALAGILRRVLLPVLAQLQLNKLEVQTHRLVRHLFTVASHADGVSFFAAGGQTSQRSTSTSRAEAEPQWLDGNLQQHGGWQQTVDAARGTGGQLLDAPGQLFSAAHSGRCVATKIGLALPSQRGAGLEQKRAEKAGGIQQLTALRSLQAIYVQRGSKSISRREFPPSIDNAVTTKAAAQQQEEDAAAWLERVAKPLPDVWAAVEAARRAGAKAMAIAKAIRNAIIKPNLAYAPP